MEKSTSLRQTLALRVLLFMVWLLLVSWPFWISPAQRTPGFLFAFFFIIWAALILVLWMMAAMRRQRPRPPGGNG